jgi:hypothetical protein
MSLGEVSDALLEKGWIQVALAESFHEKEKEVGFNFLSLRLSMYIE